MYAQLLQDSALLGFTVAALVIFIAVFFAIVVRVSRMSREEQREAAQLALAKELIDER